MRKTVGILGTPIDILDTAAALERLEQFVQERRFHQVATANTDFLVNALSDPELRYILRNADLVIPDGMPLIWGSRLTHSRLPERVTGADIVPELARMAAEKGYRIFMLGGRPEIAQRARARLENDYPGIKIVGCCSPDLRSLVTTDCEELLQEVVCARPDILLVAFGNPKQEKWIHLYRDRLKDVSVCIGVGGTFDFLAGETVRAPGWMQRSGLEWVFRLMQEPRRLWKRYGRDMVQFGRFMLRQWWAMRRRPMEETPEFHEATVGDCALFSLIGDFDKRVMDSFQAAAERAIEMRKHLVLDFHQVTSFDGEALGTLLNLPKRAAYRECEVRLVSLPRSIEMTLRRSQMHDGRYKIFPSVASALANPPHAGLNWSLQLGAKAAVLTAEGVSEHASVRSLEQVCRNLLRSGRRLDLDLRGVTFADTFLVATLYRISQQETRDNGEPALRLIIGETLRVALQQGKVMDAFRLANAPEVPDDAVRESESFAQAMEVAPLAAYAPRS